MIIFETTESVIEILWDVALAFFASRIALIYFALSFTSAALLGYSFPLLLDLLNNNLPLTPQLSMIITSLLMLAIPPIHSRIIIQRYEIPRVATFRLAIGAVALVLMVLAGGLVGYIAVVGRREGEEWWSLRGSLSLSTGDDDGEERKKNSLVVWMVLLGWLAWYALMPFGMMFLERREQEEEEEEREEKKQEVGEKR